MKFIFIFLWPPFLLLSFPECHSEPPSTDIPRNYLDSILHPEFLYPSLPIRGTLAFPHSPIPCFFKKIVFWCGIFKVLLIFFFFLQYCFCFMFRFFGWEACGILTPQPGIELVPPAVETTCLPRKSQQTYFNCFHYPPTYISFKNKIILCNTRITCLLGRK